MRVFFLLIYIVLSEAYSSKETEKITIGVYLKDGNEQFNVPLNNIVHINNYEGKNIPLNITTEVMPTDDPFEANKAFCSFLEKTPRLVAVFASESNTASEMIQIITSQLNLPYIQTSWRQPVSYSGSPTSINYYPDFDLLSLGLVKLVESLHWPSFVILYENFDGLLRLQEVLKLHQIETKNHKNMVVVKQLDFKKDIKATLKNLKQYEEKRIILDCELEHIMEVLIYAKELGSMSLSHSYFLTSMDAHTLDLESLDVEANITTVRIINPETEEFNITVQNWKNTEFMDRRDTYVEPYKIYTESMMLYESITAFVKSINDIYANNEITFHNLSCTSYEMFDNGVAIIENMKSQFLTSSSFPNPPFDINGKRTEFPLILIEGNRDRILATWHSRTPETVNIIRSAEESRSKQVETLKTRKIIISSRLEEPYLMENELYGKKPGEERYKGYVFDLMKAIAEKLNFTFEIRLTEDMYNGAYDPFTKTWTGIIGDIREERALFGISDLTITPDREAVVDFSMPFMRLGVGILLKKPKIDVNNFAFLDPFTKEVWMYTATLYLSISIVLYFVARMAPGDWENAHPCNLNPDELENIWTMGNCLWLTMGSIMNQGSDILPKGISSRLVASMWWFFALIVTNSYIASLAAFLTVKASVVDDLEDLAKQNKIKYGTLKSGATREFFRQSNYSTYRRMYANMQLSLPTVFAQSTHEGVQMVRNSIEGSYAYLMESSSIDYLINQNCDLTTVDKWFNNRDYGIAMAIDCPYRTLINDAILSLQEAGNLIELKKKWWDRKDKNACPAEIKEGDELRMERVGGIFIILGIGLAVALLLGILEFLWTARQKSVDEHITYWEAVKTEFLFALKVWINQKRITQPIQSRAPSQAKDEEEWKEWPEEVTEEIGE